MKTMLFLLVLSLAACNAPVWGTNTGNPGYGEMPIIEHEGARSLGMAICYKIAACFNGANSNSCMTQILTVNQYTSEIGANASVYATLSDLEDAEIQHQVTVNSTNAFNCRKAISDLSCSDTLIQTSYSIASPSDYSGTNILFRSSGVCTQIY